MIRAEWRHNTTGSSRRRTTEFLVVEDDQANFPNGLEDNLMVTAAIEQADAVYGSSGAEFTGIDGFYEGLPLNDYQIKRQGMWRGIVTLIYQYDGNPGNATSEDPSVTYSSRASTETVTIKNGYSNVAVWRAPGAPLPGDSYDTILNPTIDGQAEGFDIQVPVVKFSFRYTKPASQLPVGFEPFSVAYEDNAANLSGSINQGVFASRAVESVRFDGFNGTVNTKNEVELQWDFTRRALNIPSGLPDTMEKIREGGEALEEPYATGSPSYNGFDVLSVIWQVGEDAEEKVVLPTPQYASIIRAVPRGDFSTLAIPGL